MPTEPGEQEEAARRRLRRNGVFLVAVLDLLVVAVGLSAVYDLRRLASPAGAAQAWVEAAAGGDCDRFLALLTPAALTQALTDARAHDPTAISPGAARADACRSVRRPGLAVTGARLLQRGGDAARVEVGVRGRPAVVVAVSRQGGRWLVTPAGLAALPAP